MEIDSKLTAQDLKAAVARVLASAGRKVRLLDRAWEESRGTPVFTVEGKYTSRGWTEWTQGFQYGCAILAFDGGGDGELLELGRRKTRERMSGHLTHVGVHDHGFNNISTYGNLRRLMREGRIPQNAAEMEFYELAIKVSGAVQANRWATTSDGGGYIYSFNGPHSLFVDTIRTLRVLGLAHQLGQVLMGENDVTISLLDRLIAHGQTTARYNIYFGQGRDIYDLPERRGRTAHETIFNRNDGRFRCPNSQQGYSPFSTWTRGLAWAVLGFAEQLEFLSHLKSPAETLKIFEDAARATADFYVHQASAADGVPYWDTGAPNLHRLGDWQRRAAEPFNDFEPVDSSAAAIGAQGLLRLGKYLGQGEGDKYRQAGLTVARTLFGEPYLSESAQHQGLLLHSVYHRPNGWDYIPAGRKVPCGESSLWGDYHAIELAVLIQRLADASRPYYTFFN